MFSVGDLVIYATHGICRIDDICKKTYAGMTKTYYVMHPIDNDRLIINNPTDNENVVMMGMMNEDEAKEIIKTFNEPGVQWVEKNHDRARMYNDIINSGNRKDIAKVANTLIRKKHMAESINKKFGDADQKLLTFIQNILYKELAYSLKTTFEAIEQKVESLVMQNIIEH
ncbi:CarD family transcriptional regulator [Calidifontibacillus oryziterrae]|uniref:CarD family transcriptional regulator n=1 Tax=Calidifontibacillus oryziterrae TaxID=1191699 RepID=UPI00031F97F7|nr:CarD family transcriptional regulator [Calidifontibacillus oryziterrae]